MTIGPALMVLVTHFACFYVGICIGKWIKN